MGYQVLHSVNQNPSCKTLHLRRKNSHNTTLFSGQAKLIGNHRVFFQRRPISATAIAHPQRQKTNVSSVEFTTLGSCKLGIARYPDFGYNADGGQGSGTVVGKNGDDISIEFDVTTLYIPPLTTATTTFLGMPLPPFLRIDIVPELFKGTINQESGEVDLEFKAKFLFSVGSLYRARPLLVETILTTEESEGTIRKGRGERVDEDGRCRLVGVATVQPINDILMDSFLGLPTECLADLNAIITFSSS